MEPGSNRVFINPNFNKSLVNSVPVRQVTSMHVNPNFYKQPQNEQSKTKIYINPNFVRKNDVNIQYHFVRNTPTTHHTYAKPSPLVDSSNTLTVPIIPTKHEVHSSVQTKPGLVQAFQTQSRYSLVRQKKVEEPQTSISKPQSSTIRISKYKSIKITDIKKNLDLVAPIVRISPFKVSKDHKSMIRNSSTEKVIPKTLTSNINRYKLVRPSASAGKPQFKRQSSVTTKIIIRTRIKAVGSYKKNNIPCPQYRKYGKCLRKLYGKCEFLHDKKHVSICRKFLNGVCHNNACLLSHELSDKKMPTCYFYLKGMCTKEGCPYLHVKLNEKAKICPDFMKGYCEKGDKCLNRHVTSSKPSNTDLKRRHSLKKPSPQKLMKYKLEKNRTKINTSSTPKRKTKIESNLKSSQENNDLGGRYYKDSVQETSPSESLEMIKPMRCKLGTLPSFIQL